MNIAKLIILFFIIGIIHSCSGEGGGSNGRSSIGKFKPELELGFWEEVESTVKPPKNNRFFQFDSNFERYSSQGGRYGGLEIVESGTLFLKSKTATLPLMIYSNDTGKTWNFVEFKNNKGEYYTPFFGGYFSHFSAMRLYIQRGENKGTHVSKDGITWRHVEDENEIQTFPNITELGLLIQEPDKHAGGYLGEQGMRKSHQKVYDFNKKTIYWIKQKMLENDIYPNLLISCNQKEIEFQGKQPVWGEILARRKKIKPSSELALAFSHPLCESVLGVTLSPLDSLVDDYMNPSNKFRDDKYFTEKGLFTFKIFENGNWTDTGRKLSPKSVKYNPNDGHLYAIDPDSKKLFRSSRKVNCKCLE